MGFYSKWITLQLTRNDEYVKVDAQTLRRIRDKLDDLEAKSNEFDAVLYYLNEREKHK